MLALAVLWAVAPAIASLTLAARHSCCQGMAMHECGSTAIMDCGNCCSARPAPVPLFPDSTTLTDHVLRPALHAASAAMLLPPMQELLIRLSLQSPPQQGSPGAGSILRI